MENVSFNFSEPQGLVLKESLGNALLLEGAWGAVLCSVNIFRGAKAAPGGTKAPVAKQPVLGRGRHQEAPGGPGELGAQSQHGSWTFWCRMLVPAQQIRLVVSSGQRRSREGLVSL